MENATFTHELLYNRTVDHQLLCSQQEKGHVHMNNSFRIGKNETHRYALSTERQVILSANLAGEIELTDAVLEGIYGAGINDPDVINVPHDVLEPHNMINTHNAIDPLGNSRNRSFYPTEGNGTQTRENVVQTSTFATSPSTGANGPANLVVIPPISLG